MRLELLQRNSRWIKDDGSPSEAFAQLFDSIVNEINNMTANIQLFKVNPSATSPSSGGEYTATAQSDGGRGVAITNFIATGTTGTFDVYIGDAASAANKVIDAASPSATGGSVERLINQVVNPGEKVWVVPSSPSAIVFMCSGVEL